MKYGNLNLGQIEALVNKLGGMENVERVLRDEMLIRFTPTLSEKEYSVTIDYTQSLSDMIAADRYDLKNEDITSKKFPVKGDSKAEVKLHLIHLNREATTKEVEDHLDTIGFQPAKIEHLLALGKKFPNLQREFPIIAFGLVWVYCGGFRFVPCLSRYGSGRSLDLSCDGPGFRWGGGCRFLAVSK